MKKLLQNTLLVICFANLFVLGSCSREILDGQEVTEPVFKAQIEDNADETKVYADNQLRVLWHQDDRIGIFNRNTYNRQYKFTGATGDNSGSFALVPDDTFVTGNELPYAYAVYPYSQSTTITNDGVITLSLPSVQNYEQNSFGRGANAMVAVADDNLLLFKNLCGYLMFKLYGSGVLVSSVTLSGNNGEVLSGKATVSAEPGGVPSLEMLGGGAAGELTLACQTPVALGSTAEDYTEFWFVLPPLTFSQGITLSVTLADGSVFTKTTSGAITITRNKRSRMAALEVKAAGPQKNEIWYTSTDGNAVSLYKSDGFGVSLVSNIYENGKGVMSFDGPVTIIGSSAFYNVKTLETVILPEGCTTVNSSSFQYCTALRSIFLPGTISTLGSYSLYGCTSLENIVLPESLQSIGYYVFCHNEKLEEVNIPQSVTYIGGGVFCQCPGLRRFTGKFADQTGRMLTDGYTLFAIAPDGLTGFSVPSGIKVINDGVFSGITFNVSLPDGLQYIYSQAFSSYGPSSIHIPETVTSLGSGVFRYSQNLVSVKLPPLLSSINSELFNECTSLESIVIPSGVTDIKSYAFRNCITLTGVEIPEKVLSIGANAFKGCTSLEKIIVRPTTPPAGANGMFDETNDCPIYVPKASLEAYKAAEYWNNYATRIQVDPDEVPVFEVSPLEVSLSGSAQTFVVNVRTNMEYHADISNNSTWITAGQVSSSGPYDFSHLFYVSQNDDAARAGLISFCDNEGNCHPVSVTQGQYDPSWQNGDFIHHSLGMRFTATWCGWCPYMNESFIKARQKLGEKYNYVMLHASSSALPFSGTATLVSQYEISGYPTGIVDGRRRVGNSTDTDAVSNTIANYVQETENNYPVVTAAAVKSSLNGRALSLDVDVYVKLAETYKITVFLIEDGVIAYQADNGSGAHSDYVHDKIARMSLTDARGDEFVITQNNTIKSFSYNVDIPAGYNIDNMSVLVFVQRKFGNQQVLQTSSGYGDYYIDNSRIVPLGQEAALETR